MKRNKRPHTKILTLTLTRILSVLALAALSTAPLFSQADPSGLQIVQRMDENETFDSIAYTGTMTIDLGRRVLTKDMKTVAEGAQKAFVEFVNPEDKGTRYLKLENEMWIYFPQEQDTVKISGHLLKEGMMGSDVSYEDALESGTLADKYDITVLGKESLDGRSVWVLDLNAKVKDAPYDRQKFWIDAERYIALKTEMYAKSGKLLKESRVLEVKQFGSRWFPTKSKVEDKLRRGNGTVFELKNIQFDIKLPEDMFSLRRLTR